MWLAPNSPPLDPPPNIAGLKKSTGQLLEEARNSSDGKSSDSAGSLSNSGRMPCLLYVKICLRNPDGLGMIFLGKHNNKMAVFNQ